MKIRNIVKAFVPRLLLEYQRKNQQNIFERKRLQQYLAEFNDFHNNEVKRNIEHSNGFKTNNNKEKLLSNILSAYHTIEKGLTMGDMRLGFGEERINALIELCEKYIEAYDKTDETLLEAVGVILEYRKIHELANFAFTSKLKERIDRIIKISNCNLPTKQISITKEEYFKNANSAFDVFSQTRHSLRDFNENETIDISIIDKVIALSQNAPSTCNRQSVRIHVISNLELLKKVLLLQNGNRGFGHRANKLIIVTADLQSWEGPKESHGPYFDAGLYTMNLLYSLHYNKIGACALNWFASIENDNKLRVLLNIPDNEVISVIIACGQLKSNFKIAKSNRKDYRSIMTIH